MSPNTNKRPKREHRELNSDTWVQLLNELNPPKIDSWQEDNFLYTFYRLGNRVNVVSRCYLKATNLTTKEERVIEIPSSIPTGREALSWVISAR